MENIVGLERVSLILGSVCISFLQRESEPAAGRVTAPIYQEIEFIDFFLFRDNLPLISISRPFWRIYFSVCVKKFGATVGEVKVRAFKLHFFVFTLRKFELEMIILL